MTSPSANIAAKAGAAPDAPSLLSRLNAWRGALLAPKKPEPSYPRLPKSDEKGQTTAHGVYAVGEVAGTPLIKLGLNAGHEMVHRLADEINKEGGDSRDGLDLVIVGSGAAGLGAAKAAKDLGLEAVVLEANHFAETIYTMTKGKWIFAEPENVELKSDMWLEECAKEELLERWRAQAEAFGFDVREFEKVEDIQRKGSRLEVTTTKAVYQTRRVILAIGKAGNPRKAGVPGETEFGHKIDHRLIDPDKHRNQNVFIYGGGDVALEAALALCDHNKVALSTIDPEFIYPKKRNVEAVRRKAAEGKIELRFNSWLKSIEKDRVSFTVDGPNGPVQSAPNDHVFEMIGAELPLGFFKKIGIRMEHTWTVSRWTVLALVFLFVYSLYALKSYGKGISAWPFSHLIAPESYDAGLVALFKLTFAPFSWLFQAEAYQQMLTDRGYQQGYLYSLLYTVVMTVFGWEAMLRWRAKARNTRYQTWRYISLISFQIGFFLIVNIIAVQAMSLKYAWRAWGLYQPYPLFFNTFFWWYEGDPVTLMWFFIGAGVLGTFVAIPLLARWHGKRFCTWICGCGGLAETLGDRWRHLSAKGERSRRWEFQTMVILAASAIVGLVVVGMYETDGNNIWWRSYSYLVDFWLVAVIPIALYPFFGGKVWCRYWCPLAAWNQVLAKWYGKLKIVSNDKCITCTECSKYCQVGVDVMAFAKNQAAFDNTNSSCIQCGICIDVCPMDVLSFSAEGPPLSRMKQTAMQV